MDLTNHTITVRRNRVEPLHAPSRAHDKDPQSEAGKRTITIPPRVMPLARLHLDEYAGMERLFVSRGGGPLRGTTRREGPPGLRVLDLRRVDTGERE